MNLPQSVNAFDRELLQDARVVLVGVVEDRVESGQSALSQMLHDVPLLDCATVFRSGDRVTVVIVGGERFTLPMQHHKASLLLYPRHTGSLCASQKFLQFGLGGVIEASAEQCHASVILKDRLQVRP